MFFLGTEISLAGKKDTKDFLYKREDIGIKSVGQ
jgi:hypothetical protein